MLAISAIWWMPYHHVWSLTYIGTGVLVVYALAAYGSAIRWTRNQAEAAHTATPTGCSETVFRCTYCVITPDGTYRPRTALQPTSGGPKDPGSRVHDD
jgi:hypothetical protein